MKFALGFAAGIATAWAALAIWQHRVVAEEDYPPPPEVDGEAFEFTGTHTTHRFAPYPVYDPYRGIVTDGPYVS